MLRISLRQAPPQPCITSYSYLNSMVVCTRYYYPGLETFSTRLLGKKTNSEIQEDSRGALRDCVGDRMHRWRRSTIDLRLEGGFAFYALLSLRPDAKPIERLIMQSFSYWLLVLSRPPTRLSISLTAHC